MKIGIGGWFVMILAILGLGFGIVGFVDPMAIGHVMFLPGADQVITCIAVGLPLVIIVVAVGPEAVRAIKNSQKKKRLQ